MSEETPRQSPSPLATTVRITELLCALPAVATQNWCDRAAAALLPMAPSAAAAVMLAHIEESGRITRQEATGVAGGHTATVTTTVGKVTAQPSLVVIDPSDPGLTHLRAGLAQSRELGWAAGKVGMGQARAGTPATFGLPAAWRATLLGKRWDQLSPTALFLGICQLPGAPAGRSVIVEVGLTGGAQASGQETEILAAVLPLIARRAVMAIGTDPAEGSQWLTPREQVILQHLLLGKSVREIADELRRSPHTIHDHVKALHRKLNATSRGELVARALGHIQAPGAAGQAGSQTSALQGSESVG